MKRIALALIFVTTLVQPSGALQGKKPDPLTTTHHEAIKNILTRYKRPITILDLCPDVHTFRDTAKVTPSVYVVLCPDNDEQLSKACIQNHLIRVILLKKEISVADLKRLGECEHFDVVLTGKSGLRYEREPHKTFEVLVSLGDYIFIDADTQNFTPEYLAQRGATLVSHMNEQGLFMVTAPKRYLYRRRWDYPTISIPGEYGIESTFKIKRFIKHKVGGKRYASDWQPGINLLTFMKLNGIYPYKKTIRESLAPLKNIKHNDMKIFNLIIQGKAIHAIDCNEEGRNFNTVTQVDLIIDCFRNKMFTLCNDMDMQYMLDWLYED